ncbi:MAG: hypothetical protein LRY73_06385 [Bacillus sp. (in: Bacteria)]|nr:hypothetical protein [Bacillus sp. (in: firmicutes)]
MLKTLILLFILSLLTGCSVGSVGANNPTKKNDSPIIFSTTNNTLVKEAAPPVKSLEPKTTPSESLHIKKSFTAC